MCLFFCGGEGGISPSEPVVTSAHSSLSLITRVHCVTATPYCSLFLPPAALATVPLLPVPGAQLKSSSGNQKKQALLCLFFVAEKG